MPQQDLKELLHSRAFLEWGPNPVEKPSPVSIGRSQPFVYKGKSYKYKGKSLKNLMVDEKHFSPADLAKAWGVCTETVRKIFENEPGVMKLRSAEKDRRKYVTLRIPQAGVRQSF